ncbi:MAG: glycosyl transferase family protein [Gallionella sp.]|jgi:anthranilate phosphoribosyltransferase
MTHPFAQYIQILGKGRRGARDMSQQEAEQAMSMILNGEVESIQTGAFLMLMRIKEETAAEMAGLAQAARRSLNVPQDFPHVDLDWASYAGKRRQLPWFILSALLLASHGHKVLMHGMQVESKDRVYTPEALAALGIASCQSFDAAAGQLKLRNFAFISLATMNPMLQHFIDLKDTLGLRSPVHSVVRMLNPGRAATSIMGVFHPGYDETHQGAAQLMGDKALAVFKGDGGEAERNPDAPCKLRLLADGGMQNEVWPALFDSRHMKDEIMDISRLGKLWRGEIEDEYGIAAVQSTAAIALRAMGKAQSIEDAEKLAAALWQARRRDYPGK